MIATVEAATVNAEPVGLGSTLLAVNNVGGSGITGYRFRYHFGTLPLSETRARCGYLLTARHTFGVSGLQMDVSTDDMASLGGNSGRRMDTTDYQRNVTVQMKLSYMTPLLGAAAAAVAIIGAPIAAAAPSGPPAQSCGVSGAGTICQSPGNVQINDAPPAANFYPYGGEAFLLGGGFGGGGFHGGGGHGGGHR